MLRSEAECFIHCRYYCAEKGTATIVQEQLVQCAGQVDKTGEAKGAIMKRRIGSDHSFGATLKRRSSSLFCIETIDESSPLGSSSQLTSLIEKDVGPRTAGRSLNLLLSSPYATDTEVSSTDGFFIVEEESDDEDTIDGEQLIDAIAQIPSIERPSEHLRTGLVFEAGAQHFDRHSRLHKERPLRVTSVMEALGKSDIQEKYTLLDCDEEELSSSPEALFLNHDDYLQVHLPGYMKRLDRLSHCNCCERLDREAEQYKSIFLTQDSVKEAKTAATSLCRLVTRVVKGELDNGFAVIRPPGHHAEPGVAGGYCILNNIAIAAAFAREKLDCSRILIVDWDVHHGNGTQSIFLNDPNVLYFSVHRWQGGRFYPFLQTGGPTHVGSGEGEGFNINVGWSSKGMGDDEYLAVWEKLLMPIAREFQPDLVLVSAGFDAALGDIGECNVTPDRFGRLTRSLMTLANGKVVCTLEGGYVRSTMAKCVESVVASLLDPLSPQVSEKETKQDEAHREGTDILDRIDATAAKNILSTIAAHEAYWACLRN